MQEQSNPVLEFIYESLKDKLNLSELEKDILDSIKEFKKEVVDRDSLIFRIRSNIIKNDWLVKEETKQVVSAMSNGIQPHFTPYEQSSDKDLLDKLLNQIFIMYSAMKQQCGYFVL